MADHNKIKRLSYPKVRRDEKRVEEFFGTRVHDPYQWMETPDTDEVKCFIQEQIALTSTYLAPVDGLRKKIHRRITDLWNFETLGCPFRKGSRYFFFENTGLKNQSCFFVQENIKGDARLLLDPNKLSKDGTISISGYSVSNDGEILAYSLSDSGSDWCTIHFKRVDRKEIPEVLKWVKFSNISWTKDSKGIFYSRYHEQEIEGMGQLVDQKLYYHQIGTPQDDDILVAEFPEHPKYVIEGEVSDCGIYLIISVREGVRSNLLYFAQLKHKNEVTVKVNDFISLIPVVKKFKSDFEYVTNDGETFIFRTNYNSPNYRLICIDFEIPHESNWKTLLWESPDGDVLKWAGCVNKNYLVVCYMHDAKDILQIRLKDGALLLQVPLDDIGTIDRFTGERDHTEFFFLFTSFYVPGKIYHVDLTSIEDVQPRMLREIKLPRGIDANKFQVTQVFYPSKDGTKIPMFLTHKKGMLLDGNSHCLLTGYGGFGHNEQPNFSIFNLTFINDFDGVVALANIRGGGEYGEKWHNAGRFLNKQNSYDDFQFAAIYLIGQKYTCSEKLIIEGWSNGGLLVAACMNQRPELFGACLAHVGVMDLLRFHKFTIGFAWRSDFGCAEDSVESFNNLRKISPLHNVRKPLGNGQYPAVLLLTADHDDRVVPTHSYKLIAELQHTLGHEEAQVNPLLIRIEQKSGHGMGKPTAKTIDEYADILAFLVHAIGIKFNYKKYRFF